MIVGDKESIIYRAHEIHVSHYWLDKPLTFEERPNKALSSDSWLDKPLLFDVRCDKTLPSYVWLNKPLVANIRCDKARLTWQATDVWRTTWKLSKGNIMRTSFLCLIYIYLYLSRNITQLLVIFQQTHLLSQSNIIKHPVIWKKVTHLETTWGTSLAWRVLYKPHRLERMFQLCC